MDDDTVDVSFWFIKDRDPEGFPLDWHNVVDQWMRLIDGPRKYRIEPATVARLEDITARDYIESDLLDLDWLSDAP